MAHAAHHTPSPRQARTALLLHAGIYCAVNVLLVLINLWTDGDYWFQWPLFGWGAGLALHAWVVASRVGLRPSGLDRGAAPQSREEGREDGGGV